MIEYADTSGCLCGTILSHFGDAAARDRCDSCGNCCPERRMNEVRIHRQFGAPRAFSAREELIMLRRSSRRRRYW